MAQKKHAKKRPPDIFQRTFMGIFQQLSGYGLLAKRKRAEGKQSGKPPRGKRKRKRRKRQRQKLKRKPGLPD